MEMPLGFLEEPRMSERTSTEPDARAQRPRGLNSWCKTPAGADWGAVLDPNAPASNLAQLGRALQGATAS